MGKSDRGLPVPLMTAQENKRSLMRIFINGILEKIAGLWIALVANKRRLFWVWLIGAIVIVALVLFLPLRTVTEEKVQVYYETEIRQETFPVSEAYDSLEQVTRTTTIASGDYTVVPFGIIFPFSVDHDSARLTGSFENSIPGKFSVTGIGDRVVWELKGSSGQVDITLPRGDYNAVFREDVMWGENCSIYLSLQWTEMETVTRYRTVDTIKSVPVLVEKKRTITETSNISIWAQIFRGE
jgi:hypothetical protein